MKSLCDRKPKHFWKGVLLILNLRFEGETSPSCSLPLDEISFNVNGLCWFKGADSPLGGAESTSSKYGTSISNVGLTLPTEEFPPDVDDNAILL